MKSTHIFLVVVGLVVVILALELGHGCFARFQKDAPELPTALTRRTAHREGLVFGKTQAIPNDGQQAFLLLVAAAAATTRRRRR